MNTVTQIHFAKCRCQHCAGHIEFESERAAEITQCPHCGLDTMLYISLARPLPVEPKYKMEIPWRKIMLWAGAVIGSALVGMLIFAMFSAQGAQGGELIGMLLGGCLAGLAVFVAIMWIIFPILVHFGMKRIEKLLAQIERNSRP
jgi:hypothetical protein